jgi:predicted lipoprotein with Yx(FWY)xxD motif
MVRRIDPGLINHLDGEQITFRSWQLYLHARNKQTRITAGDGFKGLWHLARFEDMPQII